MRSGMRIVVAAVIALIVVTAYLGIILPWGKAVNFRLSPRQATASLSRAANNVEVGTGMSTLRDPAAAAREAFGIALNGMRDKTPDFTVIFAASGSDLGAILHETKEIVGSNTKIFGGTSDARAVMTDKGFVPARTLQAGKAISTALAVMTVTTKEIVFGTGAADYTAHPSVRAASMAAVRDAIVSAGRKRNEPPQIVLLTPTRSAGVEEQVIEGVEAVVGNTTIILGGSAGGPVWGVFGQNAVYTDGLSIAVIYTKLPLGWEFTGGFEIKDAPSGVVTKVDGRTILAIDGQPALDVYDRWLGGEIGRLHQKTSDLRLIKDLLTLHPLYRRYISPNGKTYFLVSHPWPKDPSLRDRSIVTATTIKTGERVFLSQGSWETLLNRIGNLPRNAALNGGFGPEIKPVLGIGSVCAGVMGAIPESERPKMPLLMNYAHGDAPFIANFTWGEQGHFPGIGNKHGNLLTSFLVIGKR